jgi:hypothetical protein
MLEVAPVDLHLKRRLRLGQAHVGYLLRYAQEMGCREERLRHLLSPAHSRLGPLDTAATKLLTGYHVRALSLRISGAHHLGGARVVSEHIPCPCRRPILARFGVSILDSALSHPERAAIPMSFGVKRRRNLKQILEIKVSVEPVLGKHNLIFLIGTKIDR